MCERTRAAAVKKRSTAEFKGHPARWWAQSQGIEVKAQGRLSPEVVAAWKKAGSPMPPVRDVPDHAGKDYAARQYRLLHALCEFAVVKKKIARNPVNIPGAGADQNLDRRPIEVYEALVMVETYPARYRAAMCFAVFTALRAGQVFALRRRDLDFERGVIAVDRAVWEPERGPVRVDTPKTEETARWVPMHPVLAAILRAHLAEFVESRTRTGKPQRASNRSRMFDRARNAAGRPDARWHDLRSLTLMEAYEKGATAKDGMAILNHKTMDASLRYQRTSEQRTQRVLIQAGDAVAGVAKVVVLSGRRLMSA